MIRGLCSKDVGDYDDDNDNDVDNRFFLDRHHYQNQKQQQQQLLVKERQLQVKEYKPFLYMNVFQIYFYLIIFITIKYKPFEGEVDRVIFN